MALGLVLLLLACRSDVPEVSQPADPALLAALPARPSLLLVTVDTLRADHLSVWGYRRETSPAIDELARQGVRLAQAQVQWPKTGPSFASMMTSTYPKDNGIVRQVGIPIPCTFRMLAEELSALGYQTEAVVANGAVGREFFFDQGFDGYFETWKIAEELSGRRASESHPDRNRAERVTDVALAAARRLDAARPYFLWVHYLDPHAPYAPPSGHGDRFQGDEHFDSAARVAIDRRRTHREIGAIGRHDAVERRRDVAFYVARYDAEIRYTDGEIGRLLGGLGALGLDRDRVTVFTSDHGESLGEHAYYFGHGRLPFQTCLHVPFIVHWPGVLEPGIDEEPVELVDLAPTLLALAGKELPEGRWAQGRSLVPRLLGRPESEGRAFSEAGYGRDGQWLRTVRDRRFKLVYAPLERDQNLIGGVGTEFTLFDLARDPGETLNVADERPEELERLKSALWRWAREPRFEAAVDAAACGDPRAVDHQTEELLRSLGYL